MTKSALFHAVLLPVVFLAVFLGIAFALFATTGKAFYVFNFGYIGTALAVSVGLSGILPRDKRGMARRASQIFIGVYLIVCVGIMGRENLQIGGFWVYLFSRVFAGATIHYLIAKILGTVIFNRVGITLAAARKDNRAFCKYLCPIPVFQKVGSRFSLMKIEIDPGICVDCGACERKCPMQVGLLAISTSIDASTRPSASSA